MTGDQLATPRQRQWIADLGAERIPEDLTRADASAWIDQLQAYNDAVQRGAVPANARKDIYTAPPGYQGPPPLPTVTHPVVAPHPPMAQTVTATAEGKTTTTTREIPAFPPSGEPGPQGPAPIAVYDEREEDRGPLTPVQVMSQQEREGYGIAETETVIVRGTKQAVVPEYGMPAKYLFARLSRNVQTGRTDVRIFASIEGLTFRANAYSEGIRKLSFEYVAPDTVPGFTDFVKETKDPQIIVRARVVLGNGTEITEEGTVRLSEITLHPSRRDPKRMVARSPVARTNFLEIAKKRALARALRWGTGFGGTALDELPPAEQETALATKD